MKSGFHAEPVVDGKTYIVPVDDGTVAAFDVPSGTKLWRTKVGLKGDISGLLLDSGQVIGASHGAVFSLSIETGDFNYGSEGVFDFGTTRLGPASVGAVAAFVTPDDVVEGISLPDGERQWTAELAAAPSSGLVSDGDSFLIATKDGQLHRLDPSSGEVTRSYETPATFVDGPAVAEGHLIALTDERALVGLDLTSGQVAWIRNDVRWAPPHLLVAGGEVVAGGSGGVLMGLDPTTGETRWQRKLSGTIRGVARSGNEIYAGNQDGQVFAVRLTSEP